MAHHNEMHDKTDSYKKSDGLEENQTKRPSWEDEAGRFPERLLEALNGREKAEFARNTEVSPSVLRSYLRGDSEPTRPVLLRLAKGASVSPEWLAFGRGKKNICETNEESAGASLFALGESEFALVPRYNVRAAAGHGAEVETEEVVASYAFRREWLHRMGLQADKLALITAHGESMEPDIRDGAMILVDLRQTTIEHEGVYVLNLDSRLVAKIVQRDIDGTIYIRSRHPAYRELVVPPERVEDVSVIGRAVWTDRILS